MRLFFAAFFPDDVVERALAVRDRLRHEIGSSARWSGREHLHVTLDFLGEQTDEAMALAIEAGREIAQRHAPFECALGGLGAFPSVREPRVLWIGILAGFAPLVALADDLRTTLEPLGFAPEGEHGYHPHLTLARLPGHHEKKVAARILDRADPVDVGGARIDRFALMESRPEGGRHLYVTVADFALGG